MTENAGKSTKKILSHLRRHFVLKHWLGILLGITGGFIYYRTVGCSTGACPIQSNPWLTMLWGGMMGYLIGDMIPYKKKEKQAPGPEAE